MHKINTWLKAVFYSALAVGMPGCTDDSNPEEAGEQAPQADAELRQDKAVTPPDQPTSGPGGSEYAHADATVTHANVLTSFGPMTYTLYEPAAPQPRSAPVLAFLMGNFIPAPSKLTHELYGAFYRHLARKGYTVIHPDNGYNSVDLLPQGTSSNEHAQIVGEVVAGALSRLTSDRGRVRPAVDKQGMLFAIGGHSWGGMLAQFLANRTREPKLPTPRSLILIDSTDRGIVAPNPENPLDPGNIILPSSWDNIAAETKVLQFRLADSLYLTYGVDPLPYTRQWVRADAEIRRMLTTVPDANYSYAYIQRDSHGSPALESRHMSLVGTTNPALNASLTAILKTIVNPWSAPHSIDDTFVVDTIDYFGLWKATEAMLNLTLMSKQQDRKFAFESDGESFHAMGHWSDGQPVRPILGKSAFKDFFDLAASLPPATPPAGLLISGAPTIDFGAARTGSVNARKVIVASFGPQPIEPGAIQFTGPDAAAFQVTPGITPAADKIFTIDFTPTRPGIHNATLVVEFELNGTMTTTQRDLSGEGTLD